MNAPKLRFKGFNDGWQKKELREISQIYDGTHQTPNYIQNGVPFVSVEDISDIEKTNKFISKNAFEKEFKIKPQVNDILMTRITAGIIGATAIVKNNNPLGYYVSLALIRKNKEIDVNYLNQYINCFKFKKELNKRIIHVAFPKKINLGDIGKCKISITSINEQQKIGKMLNILDRKIELQSKKIEDLKLFKKGLLISKFSNKVKNIKLEEIIKKGKAGGTPKSTVQKYYDGTIPFLSISDISSQNKYIKYTEKCISKEGLKNSSTWLVPKNSIILSMYASYGLPCINKIELATSQAMYSMIFKDDIDVEFIYYYLYYLQQINYYDRLVSTGTQSNLNAEKVNKIKIYCPNYDIQKNISKLFVSCDRKILLEENKLLKLQELKKGLMQSMFV